MVDTQLTELEQSIVGDGTDVIGDEAEVSAQLAAEQDMIEQEFGETISTPSSDTSNLEVKEVDVDGRDVTRPFKHEYRIEEQEILNMISPEYEAPEFTDFYEGEQEKGNLTAAVIKSYNSVYRGTKALAGELITTNWEKDPSFDVREALKTSATEGYQFNHDEIDYLTRSNNLDNYEYRLMQVDELRKAQNVMAQHGTVANLTAGLIGTMVDVDMLLPSIKMAKITSSATRLNRLENTLSRAKLGAVEGAKANVATGTVLAQSNPYYSEDDIVADFAMGIGLGSMLGAITGGISNPQDVPLSINEKGELVTSKEFDDSIEGIKEYYNRFEGQEAHSDVSRMPVTGNDVIKRAKNAEANLEASRAVEEPEGVKTPESTDKVTDDAVLAPESVKAKSDIQKNLEEFSPSYKKMNKTESPDFDLFINLKGKTQSSISGTLPTKKDIKAAATKEGEVAPNKVVKASPELLNTVNARLKHLYETDKIKRSSISKMTFAGDTVSTLELTSPNGQKTILKGDEAEVMAGTFRDMMFIDTSASMSKMSDSNRIVYQKDIDNIIDSVSDIGTDASRLLKADESWGLSSIVNKLVETSTGDHTLGGMSAARLKEGYIQEYIHGYELFHIATNNRAYKLMDEAKKYRIFRWLGVYLSDTSFHNKAYREIADLINDLHLRKSPTKAALADNLNGIINKYYDLQGAMKTSDAMKADLERVAKEYNIPYDTLQGTVGITITSRKVLDSWKSPVKESADVLPVLGTEKLEHDWYVHQSVNPEFMNQLVADGVKIESLELAVEQAYFDGIRLKNPEMDIEVAQEKAHLVSKAVIGRTLSAPSATSVEFAAKDTTKFMKDYLKNNPNIAEENRLYIEEVLDNLKNEKSTPGLIKERVPFDRTATMELEFTDGSTQSVKAGDFLETPNMASWGLYMNRSSGIAALASKGINSESQLNSIKSVIQKELSNKGIDEKRIAKLELLYDTMIAAIKSEPAPLSATRSTDSVKIYNSIKQAFGSSVLNNLFLPQLAEYANVIKGISIRGGMRNMGLDKLNAADSKTRGRTIASLEEIVGNGNIIGLFESPMFTSLEDTGYNTFSKKVDKFFETTQTAQRKFFGHQWVTAMERRAGWMTTMSKVGLEIQAGKGEMTPALRRLGITPDLLKVINRELEAGRMYMDRDVMRMNYQEGTINHYISTEDRIRLTSALKTIEKNSQVLRPIAGTTFVAQTDPLIGIFTHLQSYNMFSLNQNIIPTVTNFDKYAANYVLTTAMASVMVAYLKAYIENKSADMEVQHAIFKYNALLSVPGMGMDLAADITGQDWMRATPDYATTSGFNVPIQSYLSKVMQVPGALWNVLTLEGLSSQDARALKTTIPLLNNPFTAGSINAYIDWRKETEKAARREANRVKRINTSVEEETRTSEERWEELNSNDFETLEAFEALDKLR